MNREGHDSANFFVGTEVEHSPAYGKKTLFVVGLQQVQSIKNMLTIDPTVEHIYFGANQSFDNRNPVEWEEMINPFLKQGIWCTLDVDVRHVDFINESSLIDDVHFIPMISVKLPYIKLLNSNYNATIKLDDVDFKATNPGVWCHSLHELMERDKFTSWDSYTNDTIIK